MRIATLIACCVCAILTVGCGGGNGVTPPATAPVISAVTPSAGEAGTPVQFSATASGSPTAWQWDFGTGTLPATSLEATPTVTLLSPATYAGTVIATNAIGSSPPFAFSYTATPVTRPRIIAVTPADQVLDRGDSVQFQAVVIGNAASWAWDFGGAATPNTSTDESPTIALSGHGIYPGSVTVNAGTGEASTFSFAIRVAAPPVWQYLALGECGEISAEVIAYHGRPAFGYIDTLNVPHLMQASVAVPQMASDWVDTLVHTGRNLSDLKLTVIADRLAMAYNGTGITSSSAWIAQARVESPQGPADWRILEVAQGHVGWQEALVDFEGRPAITFSRGNGRIWVAIPRIETPLTEVDWFLSPVEEQKNTGRFGSLVVLGDRLAIGYCSISSSAPRRPKFAIAQVAHPEFPGHWQVHEVTESGSEPRSVTAALFDGRPILCVASPDAIVIARALVPLPSSSADWTINTAVTSPTSAIDQATMQVIDGRLLVAWNDQRVARMARSFNADPTILDWEFDSISNDTLGRFVATGAAAGHIYTLFEEDQSFTDTPGLRLAVAPDLW